MGAKSGLRPLGPQPGREPYGALIPKYTLPALVFADYTNVAHWWREPVSDCVGYWLEWQIFQGVILFQRDKYNWVNFLSALDTSNTYSIVASQRFP
jgi:hypothetical protein